MCCLLPKVFSVKYVLARDMQVKGVVATWPAPDETTESKTMNFQYVTILEPFNRKEMTMTNTNTSRNLLTSSMAIILFFGVAILLGGSSFSGEPQTDHAESGVTPQSSAALPTQADPTPSSYLEEANKALLADKYLLAFSLFGKEVNSGRNTEVALRGQLSCLQKMHADEISKIQTQLENIRPDMYASIRNLFEQTSRGVVNLSERTSNLILEESTTKGIKSLTAIKLKTYDYLKELEGQYKATAQKYYYHYFNKSQELYKQGKGKWQWRWNLAGSAWNYGDDEGVLGESLRNLIFAYAVIDKIPASQRAKHVKFENLVRDEISESDAKKIENECKIILGSDR